MTGDEMGRAVVGAGSWTVAGAASRITEEEGTFGAAGDVVPTVARGSKVGAAVEV